MDLSKFNFRTIHCKY